MENLEYYRKLWNLKDPEEIAETPRGEIYKVRYHGNLAALKILTADGLTHERKGFDFLNIMGELSCVKVYEQDEEAILMEYLDGPTLDVLVRDGKDDQATEIIAGLLNKIHQCPIPNNYNFFPLKTHFHSLFKYAEQHPDTVFDRAVKLLNNLLDHQTDIRLLHGDVHHFNIMQNHQGAWRFIDPKGIVGDRAYDAANTLLSPWGMSEIVHNKDRFLKQTAILSKHMKIDKQKLINYAFVHACIAAVWMMKDKKLCEHCAPMIEIIEPLAEKV